MIDMIKIEVEKSTRKVVLDRAIIGNDLENLQDELEFSFKDEFVNGAGRLDYELPNGDKGYIPLTKVGETYTIPLRNVLMKEGLVYFQIVITQVEIEEEIPVFKSNTFYFIVSHSINAEEEAPDDYQTWIELFEEKIAEVQRLDIDITTESGETEVVITRKDGSQKRAVVSGSGTDDHAELENLDYEHSGHTGFQAEIEDLEEIRTGASLGATAVQDNNYVHTDNNYTNVEKEKLADLENYDDTKIQESIDYLENQVGEITSDISELNSALENEVTQRTNEVLELNRNKQNKLIPGDGIEIVNNVISSKTQPYETINAIGNFNSSYLANVSYTTLDYRRAKEYFDRYIGVGGFNCSAIVKNGILGRNYDWFYSDQAEFRVTTNKTPNRYASTGIASLNGFNKSDVQQNINDERFIYVPFSMLDGQNEKGLQCAILVVPYDSGVPTTGTTVSTTRTDLIKHLNALMLIRYCLDKFATIEEVKEATSEYLSIYVPQVLRDMGYEVHFIFKDNNKVEVLEFISNECVWTDITSKPVLTNFIIHGVTFKDNGKIYEIDEGGITTCGLTGYSQGLERYNILVDGLTNNSTVKEIMESVKYTQLYTKNFNDEHSWVSEYCGTNALSIGNNKSDFQQVYTNGQSAYATRSRNIPITDQTVHTSIYEEDKLVVYTQEDYTNNYEFDIVKTEDNKEVFTGYYDIIHDKFYTTMQYEEEIPPVDKAIFIDIKDINAPATYLCVVSGNTYHYSKTKGNVLYWLNNKSYLYGEHTYLPAIDGYALKEIYDNEKKGISQILYWVNPNTSNVQDYYFKVLSANEYQVGQVKGYSIEAIILGRYSCVYSWTDFDITDVINPIVTEIGGSSGTSDFDQLTNRPKYNGTTMTHSTNIPAVPTKTSDLTNDSNFVEDANYVHTDSNYTSTEKTKLVGIEDGAEVNNVDDVQINGSSIVENKVANIDVEEAQEIIIDTSATQSSSNLITSGAVYEAVNNKVSDVKVNGTSIVDGNKVANIPYASTSVAGVWIAKTVYGLTPHPENNGTVFIQKSTNQEIDAKSNNYKPIVPANLDYAVRSVRPEVKTALDTPLQVNTIYDLDDVASLTLQLPQGQVGDFLVVQFVCKTTATALSITSAYGMTDLDLTPEVGNTYSIYGEWGKIDTNTYGWKLSSFEASIPTI